MTKSELLKRMWIPISKRIPPPDQDKWVLIWNYRWKEPMVQSAFIANLGAQALLNKEEISEDRIYSHWIEIIKP